jgi:hypothetical protein
VITPAPLTTRTDSQAPERRSDLHGWMRRGPTTVVRGPPSRRGSGTARSPRPSVAAAPSREARGNGAVGGGGRSRREALHLAALVLSPLHYPPDRVAPLAYTTPTGPSFRGATAHGGRHGRRAGASTPACRSSSSAAAAPRPTACGDWPGGGRLRRQPEPLLLIARSRSALIEGGDARVSSRAGVSRAYARRSLCMECHEGASSTS